MSAPICNTTSWSPGNRFQLAAHTHTWNIKQREKKKTIPSLFLSLVTVKTTQIHLYCSWVWSFQVWFMMINQQKINLHAWVSKWTEQNPSLTNHTNLLKCFIFINRPFPILAGCWDCIRGEQQLPVNPVTECCKGWGDGVACHLMCDYEGLKSSFVWQNFNKDSKRLWEKCEISANV